MRGNGPKLDRLYAAVAKMPEPYYDDGNGRIIYHADCRELLPMIEPGSIDLVLTDPPYGIDYKPTFKKWNGAPSAWRPIAGDGEKFDPAVLLPFPKLIIWGANYFSDLLPVGDWLLWDKRCDSRRDSMFGSPVEIAWTQGTGRTTIKRLLHGGVVNADSIAGNNERRFHPTQKPVELMRWCLQRSDWHIILDPFLGSGTTLRACKDLDRCGIGIEIEEKYCDIAANRLAQKVLFS